ncbi:MULTISPECIES: hypothetical protein [unclassified Microcystis]|uniref:hypothetical protein n=1 Tax=unclassified Microcystis TaxID=2643300 RepID=UPI002584DF41|nr:MULTISPECIES: hypothetical protein [unclassified Microcystis]MCA2671002.1 hypothetical protein [Microcystis sp. M080S2]MCA2683795.1 hypothetical protein [Microcystis sp. M046S2]MCA2948560.1 hypothetical protein [Microcystis sp. M109S1]
MKKFSSPEMKEVSLPTPHTPHPTPYPHRKTFSANPIYRKFGLKPRLTFPIAAVCETIDRVLS